MEYIFICKTRIRIQFLDSCAFCLGTWILHSKKFHNWSLSPVLSKCIRQKKVYSLVIPTFLSKKTTFSFQDFWHSPALKKKEKLAENEKSFRVYSHHKVLFQYCLPSACRRPSTLITKVLQVQGAQWKIIHFYKVFYWRCMIFLYAPCTLT